MRLVDAHLPALQAIQALGEKLAVVPVSMYLPIAQLTQTFGVDCPDKEE